MQKYKVSMNVSTNILLTKKTKKKMRYYFQMRYTGHALRVMLTSLWWEVTMAAPRESMCCEQCGKLRASGCSGLCRGCAPAGAGADGGILGDRPGRS